MEQQLVQIQPVEFSFRSGQVARSVSDLLLILIDMDDEEFVEHLHKGDFVGWVDQVLRNPTLTRRVRNIQSKRELIQLLKENVQYRLEKKEFRQVSKPVYSVVDFDLDSGEVVRTPSRAKEVEAWEKQFFESTQKGLVPREYVKEFLYGSAAGFLVGLILGGVLYRVR